MRPPRSRDFLRPDHWNNTPFSSPCLRIPDGVLRLTHTILDFARLSLGEKRHDQRQSIPDDDLLSHLRAQPDRVRRRVDTSSGDGVSGSSAERWSVTNKGAISGHLYGVNLTGGGSITSRAGGEIMGQRRLREVRGRTRRGDPAQNARASLGDAPATDVSRGFLRGRLPGFACRALS